ncbi:MAG TPA: glycosyltransferase [Solirubrobacteraceae bacterium]
MDAEHLILTRFAVKASAGAPPHPAEWLEYRLALFAAYCLPGLAAQTAHRFTWLVFCDEATPRWCLDRLARHAADAPQLRVALSSTRRPAVEDVRAQLSGAPVLVTTRIDSDDGSSTDLVERIAAYAEPFAATAHPSLVLNFSRGCKLDTATGRVFETFHPQSPHLTLFERTGPGHPPPLTIQSGNHGRIQERHPVHQDAGPPAWLQVVHGGNLSNHIHETDAEIGAAALDRFAVDPRAAAAVPPPPAAPQPDDAAARGAFRQGLEDALLPRGAAR